MAATQQLGGFIIPNAHEQPSPASSATQAPMNTNNPYRQYSPVPDTSYDPSGTTQVSQFGLLDSNYPSYAPPSYHLAASSSSMELPTNTDSKGTPVQSRDLATTTTPQPSRQPVGYGVPSGSQFSSTSRTLAHDQPAGPSQQPSFMDQAKARLNPRDPLNPLPLCFSRVISPPSANTTYEPLAKPYIIHALPGKKFLDEAFATTGVPAFYKHDVQAEDWIRLLEDIQIVTRLKGGQRLVAGVLPATMHMGMSGFFVSRAIEKGMKRKNAANVGDLLDIWNERFFGHRHLQVILCKGDYRESGLDRDLPAPDRPNARARPRGSHGSSSSGQSSSDSSSDSEDEHGRHAGRQSKSGRGGMRRQRREERRESRRARREERRADKRTRRTDKKSERTELYRLLVVSTK